MIPSLLAAVPASTNSGHHHSSHVGLLIAGIFFVVIGSFNAAKPDLSFRMNRWQYKNKDALAPSDAALKVTRGVGSVAVVVGIVLIVIFVAT